jgi:hypothetical protein
MTFGRIAAVCAVTIWMAAPAWAQQAPQAAEQENHEAHHPQGAEAAPAPVPPAPASPAPQMSMNDMKAMHVRLDALVTKMNAATGDARVAAMAELLTTLVRDHGAMCQGMMQMQGGAMMSMPGGMRGGMPATKDAK